MFPLITQLFLIITILNTADFEIKSLRIYGEDGENSFPVNRINIEFDIQSDFQPGLRILFRFCDSDWHPYENVFLENRGFNTQYNLWYDMLPTSVIGARYRYKGSFPNANVTFPFSGKWKFYIVDDFNTELIHASGKFLVVHPQIPIEASITKNRLEGETPHPSSFGRVFNISVDFRLNDTLYPALVDHVEIIEDRKFDYPIIINRDKFGRQRFYEWNGADKFSFYARDILPSNEYRQTDIRDRSKFSGPDVKAQIDRIDISRNYRIRDKDLGGGSILLPFSDDWSDYLNVTFQLRLDDAFNQDIFLVGAFNNWRAAPEYIMEEDKGLYKKTIELKRGIYDYQYVTGLIEGGEVTDTDWIVLEGNFWETDKEYHILVYYSQPESGGYGQVIGYKKIKSGRI